ncbi:NAD kinase [Lutimonas zeaxanthinifaciens]|uniref:NAD kinase n=1 Tax=Lutimonas zeaxanthinifaciens TaxID=3060215 RepID=UPI00265CD76F|nr:NAD kinase [Lutimonas sp. YSD2104]WKK65464.1 NAD kinase [Lutimonas sp. YSD2104]
MKVGIFGQSNNQITMKYVQELVKLCKEYSVSMVFEESFLAGFNGLLKELKPETFSDYEDLDRGIDFFFSVGGDGTFLRSITFIRDLNIPVIGINTGRLGFLANIPKESMGKAFEQIMNGEFKVQERSLLTVETEERNDEIGNLNFALNEITITRKNTASMIRVDTNLDDEFLTSYWSDGLIISTPTGSTGYSLSCGGPIISPTSKNIVLTPIAPHSLAVRPLVIPDLTRIELHIDSRADEVLLTLDSRMYTLDNKSRIAICKSPFCIKTLQLTDQTFIKTLREKLLWGEDKRN